MKLSLVRPYKSLRAFDSIDLPDFTVITGTNGAGKSQLLNALFDGAIAVEDVAHNPQHNRLIRLFDASTLVPADTGAFSGYQSKQEQSAIWQQFSNLMVAHKQPLDQYLSQFPLLAKLDMKALSRLMPDDLLGYGIDEGQAEAVYDGLQNQITGYSNNFAAQFGAQSPATYPMLLERLTKGSSLPLIAYDIDTFYDNYPMSWQPVDMFQQSFARIFSDYQSKYSENIVRLYRRDLRQESIPALTDDEFCKKYGNPPWDFLNDILQAAGLSFRINKPHDFEDRPYEPILTDTVTDAKVKFNDLSSGERILMSFALCLYYTKDAESKINYPVILLFDEIDAPLHPSMTKSLLDTIQNVLISERKIKVVMTTHSPSTVALAPDESVYVMTKDGASRLRKTSKDVALSLLMSGVPSISISYENRRQVFVESHLDVVYYDFILKKLRAKIHPAVSLSFIASSKSKIGGCAHVKDIVSQLAVHGSSTIRGLVDWDTRNEPDANVVVLGYGARYSIENYILDPLLIAMLLFQDKSVDRETLGMEEHEGSADVLKMPNERLQVLVNYVVNVAMADAVDASMDPVKCEYANGRAVQIPKGYLLMQGHSLEELLKAKFDGLKRYHKSDGLKMAILQRIVDEFPSLLPNCLIEAMRSLQQPIQ